MAVSIKYDESRLVLLAIERDTDFIVVDIT